MSPARGEKSHQVAPLQTVGGKVYPVLEEAAASRCRDDRERAQLLMPVRPAPQPPVPTPRRRRTQAHPGGENEDEGRRAREAARADAARSREHASRQRDLVVDELLQTERAYVRDLQTTCEVALLGSPHAAHDLGIDLPGLFGNLEDVTKVAARLLSLLEGAAAKPADAQPIGKCFLDVADDMKAAYGEYCTNYEGATALLERYYDDEDSAAARHLDGVVAAVRARDCVCFDLGSILIKPVQRVLKYPLLLNALLRATDDAHADHARLAASVTTATDVAAAINESKRRYELVHKYRKEGGGERGGAGLMARISVHTLRKKSARLTTRLSAAFGRTPLADDAAAADAEAGGAGGEAMREFAARHARALEQLYDLSFLPKGFGPQAMERADSTRRSARKGAPPPAAKLVETQTDAERQYVQSHYPAEDLYAARRDYRPAGDQQFHLAVSEGDVVGVVVRKDPMGNDADWFVDAGGAKGLLPHALLTALTEILRGAAVAAPPSYDDVLEADAAVAPPPAYESPDDGGAPRGKAAEAVDDGREEEWEEQAFCYALYGFEAMGEDQLSMTKRQVLSIVRRADEDGNTEWWRLRSQDGDEGFVPANYVCEYDPASV
ncbi:PREDICTED: dynamin-binding protein-like [Priapulus caudatus]|uniref:Dynamin-binding protein-like n=1 Tax=Priapulus caudatus TaxID=37621 RepID=A0ABM1ESJ4_PRICU|nr:PREDICTED: dynamin-binding protein-like [Priapulus caudatus]